MTDNYNLAYEPDSTDNLGSKGMWAVLFVAVFSLIVILFALTMYFRFEVQSEKFYKVGSRVSSERVQLEQEEKAWLLKNDIDGSINKFLRDLK